jgi:hypothetical protein
MNVWQQKTPVISKLRVKGEKVDTLAARLHFERIFGAADFLPEGMPPKAIVCIKSLRDPAPRTLRLNRFDLRFSDAWRNSVAREIEKHFRRAFRPIREIVPAQAESVVFTDNSELLACLASDWCRGFLAESWWWKSLFPNLQQAQTIARIWIEAAEFAPTALQLLAKKGKAAEFAARLQPNEAADLSKQIIRIFGLDKLQKALFESSEGKKESAFSTAENLTERENFPPKAFFAAFQKPAPWSEFVPETLHPSLSFQQQSLLGIGLMLARRPRIARSSEFARQVKLFCAELEVSRTAQRENKILESTEKPNEKTQPEIEKAFLKKDVKSSENKEAKILEDSLSSKENRAERLDVSNSLKSENFPATGKAEAKSNNLSKLTETKKQTKSYQTEKPEISQNAFSDTFEEVETSFEFTAETRFGGVFYLLNLGLYLNLYRDFTESGETEIDLNIWDFVAFLGVEFLGRKIKDDAVWELLKRLAGRENDENLLHEFAPPDEWRMPPEWVETFQTNQKWLWTNANKRLIVRHPSGFNVVDVRLRDDLQSHLENELKVYQKSVSETVESDSKKFSKHFSPANWLKNLAEYVRQRLFQALNLQTQRQIKRILFERSAKITVTATHLDVTFRLADLPLEVRLSGLDRNPGWIPAAGKYINFHFI